MATSKDPSTSAPKGISRRTLVKGTAWALPAVAVASAAPAMAASGTVTFNNLNVACKLPGASCQTQTGVKKGYVVAMELCNTVTGNPGTITVAMPQTIQGTLCDETKTWKVNPTTFTLEEAGCTNVQISLDGEPNSSNCAIAGSGNFTWTAENGLAGNGTFNFSAAETPPCVDCKPSTTGAVADPEAEPTDSEDLAAEPTSAGATTAESIASEPTAVEATSSEATENPAAQPIEE